MSTCTSRSYIACSGFWDTLLLKQLALKMIKKKQDLSLCEYRFSKDKSPSVFPIAKLTFVNYEQFSKAIIPINAMYSEFSLSNKSLDVGDRLNVTFTLQ